MEIKCDKCGATLQYSPGTQDLVCEYCGHTMKLTAAPDPNADVISDSILPLKVDNDTAISVARAYMTSGLVTPDDLVNEAEIVGVKMFYFPTYYIEGDYIAHWTASFGYDRKEYYKKWDDFKKEYVQAHRVVTDWSPQSGTVEDEFCYKCLGLNLEKLNLADDAARALREVINKLRANGTVDYDAKYMTGCVAVPYDFSRHDAWNAYGSTALKLRIVGEVHSNAQGDHQKDWNWTPKIKFHSSTRVYLPVVQVEFSYKGKNYYCYIDGSNSNNYAGSELPVDPKKQNIEKKAEIGTKLSKLPIYATGLVCAFGAYNYFILDLPVSIGVYVAALVVAFIYHVVIAAQLNSQLTALHNYSEEVRKCLLLQQQAQDGKIDPNTEEVAQSFTLPEPVKHNISYKLIPTLLVTVLVFASPVLYDSDKLFGWQLMPKSEHQTQTQAKSQTQAKQAKPADTPDPFATFNRLVVQQPITNHGEAVNEVLNELASLPKPPIGNPKAIEQYLPQVQKYFAAQDYTNAIPLLQKLVGLSPADSHLLGNLAYANYKMQKYEDAASNAAAALICEPTHSNAWKVLKASCNKLGYDTCVQNADIVVKHLQ